MNIICRTKIFCGILSAFFLCLLLLPQTTIAANVQFTSNTIIDLSGLSTTLYALSGSECDSLSVSGSTLTVVIPSGSTFTLGTAGYKVLGLTPQGGTLTFTFTSANFPAGHIWQWTEQGSVANISVNHLVGSLVANAHYQLDVGPNAPVTYKTDGAGEMSFSETIAVSPIAFVLELNEPASTAGVGAFAPSYTVPQPVTEQPSKETTGETKKTEPTQTPSQQAQVQTQTLPPTVPAAQPLSPAAREAAIQQIKAQIIEVQQKLIILISQLIQLIQEQITQLQAQLM